MDRVRFQAGNVIPKDEVYQAFIRYCQEKHLPTLAKNIFSMKLSEHVPNLSPTGKRIHGKMIRCWRDIEISEEDIEEFERERESERESNRLSLFRETNGSSF